MPTRPEGNHRGVAPTIGAHVGRENLTFTVISSSSEKSRSLAFSLGMTMI